MPPLAAVLEEWLESLGILRGNQGRSQAAPLAASRQRTRCRDRPQPQRTSRILRDSWHSGTDAARGGTSSLPASLPNKNIPKQFKFVRSGREAQVIKQRQPGKRSASAKIFS